ncbi:RNA polymerase subunit sigma-70 [Virgibacillus oceani]|uniref:RNA polymerase subunit sigma-70 n=1 Tax=Virgibacillus oceani TaxID=1479511 RepID=A0A917H2H5_9BACI|nr:RNA polymerase subunit sigma-70 [Virgibacillus oceani]GGG64691.1 hypothetical protein GCM10011398_05380 [Virgibacillus oceani]
MPRVSKSTRRMQVRSDLINHLKQNKMTTAYWYDLVEDYMKFWDLKEELQTSIRTKGAMIWVENGNQKFYKKNDAVVELPKISKRMGEILDKLDIAWRVENEGKDEGDDV